MFTENGDVLLMLFCFYEDKSGFKMRSNGREGTSFSWRRVLDHLGLTPYLHSITLLIMMGLMAGIIKLV